MTIGEEFVAGLAQKSVFHDRHERRCYERSLEIARRIVDQPSLLENARAYLERHVKSDPHQAVYYALWTALIQRGPHEIARALLDDSALGAELRGSAPVFVVLSGGTASGGAPLP